MQEYLKKISKATTNEKIDEIIKISEEDENITEKEWLEICEIAEERKEEISPKEYDEWDRFDDMWHSGEFL